MRRLIVLAALCLPPFARALQAQEDDDVSRLTLAGIASMRVVVGNLTTEATNAGLFQDALKAELELRLRQAGIAIPSDYQVATNPFIPYLYLRVTTTSGAQGLFGYSVELDFHQRVLLPRNVAVTAWAITWSGTGFVGYVGIARLSIVVRSVITDASTEFLNAYLAANPR